MHFPTKRLHHIAALIAMVPSLLFAVPPENDNFATPVVLAGFPASVMGTNADATLEQGEPIPVQDGNVAEASVWFRWTAPTSGSVRIDTLGSDFDTLLAVWNGDALTNLTLVAENDQYSGASSAVFFEAETGMTYQIAVYGWNDERGSILLNVTNDLTSRIAGTVTGPDGTPPLPGIDAVAYFWNESAENWEEIAQAQTDDGGNYTIRGLVAGTYRVQFSDAVGNYLGETYDNAADLESGADIEVLAETTVGNINAALAIASKIVGMVTGPDQTTPLQGIEVAACRSSDSWQGWETVNQVQTDGDGHYTIGGLPAGTYRVQFTDATGDHLDEVFNDAMDLESGADIIVNEEDTVWGINAALESAGKIGGNVTGPDGTTPLQEIGAAAFRWDESLGEWGWVDQVYTDADGDYLIGGLPAGIYRIQFADPYEAHVSEVYNDAADLDSGVDISLAAGAIAGGIDASLESASEIGGTVTGPDGATPLGGIIVVAYGWNAADESWGVAGEAETDADGHYAISGLVAGTYRVQFRDLTNDYAREIYDNAANLNSGADIVLSAGSSADGIDASLALAAEITGTVTGPDGLQPVESIEVEAYRWNETLAIWEWTDDAQTDGEGHYVIGGLPAGTYRLQFSDLLGYYIHETYDDAADLDSGADIILAAGMTADGIDAALASAARITGTVSGPDGLIPLEHIDVAAYRWSESLEDWEQVGGVQTDANGHYMIGELPAGNYRMLFTDWAGDYVQEAYNDAVDLDSGTDIVALVGTTVDGIDASLAVTPPPDPPSIISMSQPESNYWEILYTGEIGADFILQETTALTNSWSDVGSPFRCEPGINAITVESTEPILFRRLKASP